MKDRLDLREALKSALFALSFHDKTRTGLVRPCLPECIGCEAIRAGYAALNPKPKRIDWLDVVVDEGDEGP